MLIDFAPQQARLAQATRKGEGLAAAIQEWVASCPWNVEAVIQDDRLGWRLILHISNSPPLDDWSLVFGEAVHHLRALLDNAVVAIGTAQGLDSKQLKQLQFPIAGGEEEWQRAKRRVQHLSKNYRAAIESLQPFQRQGGEHGTPEQDLLLLLRDFDNQDKHHLQVQPLVDPAEIEHGFSVEFETEAGATRSVPPDTEVNVDAHFVDGACLMLNRTKGRIKTVRGAGVFRAQVKVTVPGHNPMGITEALAALCFYTGTVLTYLSSVED